MTKSMPELPMLKTNSKLYDSVLEFLESELGDYTYRCTYTFISSAETTNYIEFRFKHDFHSNYGTCVIDMGFSLMSNIEGAADGEDVLMLEFGDDIWHEIAYYDESVKYFWMRLLAI